MSGDQGIHLLLRTDRRRLLSTFISSLLASGRKSFLIAKSQKYRNTEHCFLGHHNGVEEDLIRQYPQPMTFLSPTSAPGTTSRPSISPSTESRNFKG